MAIVCGHKVHSCHPDSTTIYYKNLSKVKKLRIKPQWLVRLAIFGFLVVLIQSCGSKSQGGQFAEDSCYVNIPPALPGVDPFNGKICLDVRDSKSDWDPFTPTAPPEGAPNILFVLYDDTGLGAWSPYGGAINMPTMQELADSGLTYTQWHTTALCSPTRSTILTGRNHHLNGMASITETADGFPGANGRVPPSCASFAEILQDNGYGTFWVGKNHNVPEQDVAPGGNRAEWPCQVGFDRFYGFLGGETNNWYPDLVEDNHFIEKPTGPENNYHLSKDLADKSIEMLRNLNASNPSKPFYMWFNPGANHAPHHSPAEYTAKYAGKFDDGYEAYREWVVQRMIEKGVIPDAEYSNPLNPMDAYPDEKNIDDDVIPWGNLGPQEKKLFSRMAEVYAGFSEYTDAQVGRIIDYLKESGQYENTIIIYAADNGASGEGTPYGSVNENKFFNGYPDNIVSNMLFYDKLGGPETYNHFPTGWANAFSAPFKMFKRYSQYAGGTNDPLVICWPKGIKEKGKLRHQYHHSVDIVPTLLDAIGIEMPDTFKGVKQIPLSGEPMNYTFEAIPEDDPTEKKIQYYSMLGTRGIWRGGWKAVAVHAPLSGKGGFEADEWELYHVAEDRAESLNLADSLPDTLASLKQAWFDEAWKNGVLPLDDRSAAELLTVRRPSTEDKRLEYTYYPLTAPVPEGVAVNVRNRPYRITAKIVLDNPSTASGVMFAHGSRFGGHALYIKDNYLHYHYNFLGIPKFQQNLKSNISLVTLAPGEHEMILDFELDRKTEGENGEPMGLATLYIDQTPVDTMTIRTQPAKFTLSGDGLCIGYDSGDKVTRLYPEESEFTGAELKYVKVKVTGPPKINIPAEARRIMLRE